MLSLFIHRSQQVSLNRQVVGLPSSRSSGRDGSLSPHQCFLDSCNPGGPLGWGAFPALQHGIAAGGEFYRSTLLYLGQRFARSPIPLARQVPETSARRPANPDCQAHLMRTPPTHSSDQWHPGIASRASASGKPFFLGPVAVTAVLCDSVTLCPASRRVLYRVLVAPRAPRLLVEPLAMLRCKVCLVEWAWAWASWCRK